MSVIDYIGKSSLIIIILIFLWSGFVKKVPVFDVFLEGVNKGLKTVLSIIPSLLGLIVAVGVFKASGALDIIVYAFKPISYLVGIPSEILPLAFLRPISGGASLALVAEELSRYGADSYIGRVISTMMGSTETIFYTMTIYLGAVGIKKSRYALPAAIIATIAALFASVWVCKFI